MFVKKRDGRLEKVSFDKITTRIDKLINNDERKYVSAEIVAQKTIVSIYPNITTEELDIASADICVNLCTTHHLYTSLAGRILVSNLHKKTLNTFVEKQELIQSKLKFLNKKWIKWLQENRKEINEMVDYSRDYLFDYFGFKTLERAYLTKINNIIIERPSDMFLRVASFLNCGNLEQTKKTYDLMSQGYYTHATPTLFNAGNIKGNLASCFLLGTEDSIIGIYKTLSDVAQISKYAGGIGLHISNIRAKGSPINGTNGISDGIIPMLRVYNETARYCNQSGRRKGSIAIYLEPYHPDILAFLDLRKNNGTESERARDLFLALWIPDLFMKQVECNGKWYLMCPFKCPNLNETYGEEFEKLYWKYVEEKKYNKEVNARDIMDAILTSQIETGTPYICYKDSINRKSNQKNIGIIKSSNLCAEIVEYSSNEEYAVCNLASIAINKFVIPFEQKEKFTIYTKENCKYCKFAKTYLTNKNFVFEEKLTEATELKKCVGDYCTYKNITYPQIFYGTEYIGGYTELFKFTSTSYDFDKLFDTAYTATHNLNNVIDINFYPVIETKKSNIRHRPIALGIQGVADALSLLRIEFESEESLKFNTKIMETIYLASLTASKDISKSRDGMILFDEKIPEYYDPNFKFLEIELEFHDLYIEELNDFYHRLKPNRCEIGKKYYGAYSSFEGSPMSEGKFQFDLWGINRDNLMYKEKWLELEKEIKLYGVRNSLTTALMPTASTSQILGNNECFEPFTNNIYTRRTLAGEFPLVNKYLIEDLIDIGVWSEDLKQLIVANNGSISEIDDIPVVIKNLYKTIWEIKQVWVLKNALARSPFIDQTQSLNIFMGTPDNQKLYSSHFWAWKNGLKTGIYYLRSKASADAVKFTVDPSLLKKKDFSDSTKFPNSTNPSDSCESCSA